MQGYKAVPACIWVVSFPTVNLDLLSIVINVHLARERVNVKLVF